MECKSNSGAAACIRGDSNYPRLRGSVRFLQHRDGVLVVAQISGLPETKGGFFGFHIHEGETCDGAGFTKTGSHYDTAGNPHPQHTGDLPPILNAGGKAFLCVVTDRFCLDDIIGKTVVIHSGSDDFTSQPAGNAGTKIACGVICPM